MAPNGARFAIRALVSPLWKWSRMHCHIALLCIVSLIGFSKQTPLKDGNDFLTCFEMDDENGSCYRKTISCAEEECSKSILSSCQTM